MEGWRREYWFDQTGLTWVQPSPNLPTLDSAMVYPGFVLVEGTCLSEGRGTTRPFEMIGAPFINSRNFAARLNGLGLSGVLFRPSYFQPTFQKWANTMCGGVQIHVRDREVFEPYLTGIAVLSAACALTWIGLPPVLHFVRLAAEFLSRHGSLSPGETNSVF